MFARNLPVKPSGPELLFVVSFKITDSISLLLIGLFIFSFPDLVLTFFHFFLNCPFCCIVACCICLGFPGGVSGKELTRQCWRQKRHGLIPGRERSHGGVHGNLL